ncbi:uncharacterized protein LOC127370968 [Dicentrarchus labrax]|uniref:uncharacterized protein LOC127370968 n=1 Tax=Dicentrarchus labrax TaxID=13489 RepID=UPI0021F5FDB8|nr:uncharacterized protein LOC127370968 [Dicentrarchus labrax]
MSSEKNPEVVGCDASIMRNVWEIREREYEQKMQQERERIENSALPSINKDWEGRLQNIHGNYKRVERKTKPAEDQTDNKNVLKSKKPQVPPTPHRGAGSGPLGRRGDQKRGFSTPTPNYKDKKGQNKNLNRLMFLTQTQPSAMVWGKSWKYNKSLPPPEDGAAAPSDWGKCWMFATHQPYSEPGKPWLNGPNMLDPQSLHLCKKPECRMVESQELDLCLPTEEWQMSWRKSDKNSKKGDSGDPKFGIFTMLVETQHHNEVLCSSEWSDSWSSIKPASQQDNIMIQNDGLLNKSVSNKQDNNVEMSPEWEECWRLVNHHGCNNFNLPQVQKCHSPEWADSWRAAMVVLNNHKNSDPSLSQDYSGTCDDHSQQKESHLHKNMLKSHEQKYRDLYSQLYNELKGLSEWSKSWQVNKNNSKPCQEIEKALKVSPPKMETDLEAQNVEKDAKGHYSTSEKVDPRYEQLRHSVIYHSRREFTQSHQLHLKHLENVLSVPEWKDSWQTLKHRMRMERRRMRPDPSRPFRASEKGGDRKPTASEWKNSWKLTCQPLRQEPEPWQQGWSTTPRIRVDRAWDQNHFAPVEHPKNGPTVERNWGESWRFSRVQHRSELGQDGAQTNQGRSSVASQFTENSQTNRSSGQTCHARSDSDWQDAWMVSETQFHHDKPSLTQWREAWRCSVFNTEHWTEQVPREERVDVLMAIQPQTEKLSFQRANAKISRSFDNQIFRERYPEKQWSASWRAGKSMGSGTRQQHGIPNEYGSKWGMSFRLANPMPHMEQPWVESSPNPCYYRVMWSRGKKVQNNINTNFSNNPSTFRLWGNSYCFLQGARRQMKNKPMSKPIDPRVIMTKNTKTRKHLYSTIEKEKQSDRKWLGCHLLGKTQPRPKKGLASGKKLKMDDKNKDKFFEEWAESWRFLLCPGSLKKQMPRMSLSGWEESWKFLLPPYQPMNGPKAR